MNLVRVFDLSKSLVNCCYFLIGLKGAAFPAKVSGSAAVYSTLIRTRVSKRGDPPCSSPPVEPHGFLYFSNPILPFGLCTPTTSHAKSGTLLPRGCDAE